jgi:hypothetical protein
LASWQQFLKPNGQDVYITEVVGLLAALPTKLPTFAIFTHSVATEHAFWRNVGSTANISPTVDITRFQKISSQNCWHDANSLKHSLHIAFS